nr:unnamed protein product [Spirometra erinaceieuropaei]
MSGAERWTGRCLVTSKVRIRLQTHRRPQDRRFPAELNIGLLSLAAHLLQFSNELAQRLANLTVVVAAAANAADENASVAADSASCGTRCSLPP